ncbi:MAG TPA: VWA domain-containing protein [Acidobacteriota bacterium]|nr:VWA domain-containing protein [Acidobacteriota bacterium]
MYRSFQILLISLLLTGLCFSQEEKPEDYKDVVEVDLVSVYLSATDSKGNPVKDLKVEELVLKEDDAVQKISHFSTLDSEAGEIPIAVALVIDASNSMHEGTKEVKKMDIAKNVSKEVIQLLRPLDQVAITAFDSQIKVNTKLLSSSAEAEQAITDLTPSYRRTALWDAIHASAKVLRGVDGRRVMLICSDGLDNASLTKEEDVIPNDLVAGEIAVIALGTIEFERTQHIHGEDAEYKKGKKTMQQLADRTGGYAFFPKDVPDLDDVFRQVRSGVWNWYSIAYQSSNPEKDGNWRKIEIDTKRRGVRLKYRDGYYATP